MPWGSAAQLPRQADSFQESRTSMMTQDPAAPGTLRSVCTSLLISSTLVVPFIVLQWVNRRAFHENFPFVLFTFMSLHSLFIVVLLTPALRRLRSEQDLRPLTLGHWAGLVLSAVLILAYADVVIDQLPCFLGVPNCD
jgi:hypothetical protein